MEITEAMVRRVAALASLEMGDEEVAVYQGEMSRILSFVEQLNALELGCVDVVEEDAAPNPVLTRVVVSGVGDLRGDEARQELDCGALMGNGPAVEAQQFEVPNILEG